MQLLQLEWRTAAQMLLNSELAAPAISGPALSVPDTPRGEQLWTQ
jgi:hypothetical protein